MVSGVGHYLTLFTITKKHNVIRYIETNFPAYICGRLHSDDIQKSMIISANE